jgi:rhodanese-related sulfurtransferase
MLNDLPQITVTELAAQMANPPEPLQLIDVRESEELELAQLQGFIHLPLSQFPQWSTSIYQTLDPHCTTLVLCHHGVRSAQCCQWLMSQGFTHVKNIAGGIDAYSCEVNSNIPRY